MDRWLSPCCSLPFGMDLVRSLPPWSVDRLMDVFLVPLDITRLFNNVLLQQTQPLDSRNKETMTYIYTKWCVHSLLIGWGFHLHKRLLRIEPEFVIMYFIFAVSINFFANMFSSRISYDCLGIWKLFYDVLRLGICCGVSIYKPWSQAEKETILHQNNIRIHEVSDGQIWEDWTRASGQA